MNGKKIAVLGGGAVARATSAELSSFGFEVNMFELPRFEKNIRPIMKRGGIGFSGVAGRDFAKLNMVTTNAKQGLQDVDLIILAAPAYGHQAFIEACLPHLQNGQIFLIETAYYGCLRFAKTVHYTGKQVIMAEMNHTPYTCTNVGPADVYIDARRKEVFVAALPAKYTQKVVGFLKSVYTGMTPVPNVLQTSLDNVNWIAHPAITMFHRGLIERSKQFTLPLKESLPPSVIRLMEVMDEERLELGKAFGLDLPSIKHTYEFGGDTLKEALWRSTEFETFKFEYENGSNQYLEEDLYYGLPPFVSLASLANVPTPTMKSVLQIFSVIDNVCYMKEGVNAEKMGLSGLDTREVLKLVEEGLGKKKY